MMASREIPPLLIGEIPKMRAMTIARTIYLEYLMCCFPIPEFQNGLRADLGGRRIKIAHANAGGHITWSRDVFGQLRESRQQIRSLREHTINRFNFRSFRRHLIQSFFESSQLLYVSFGTRNDYPLRINDSNYSFANSYIHCAGGPNFGPKFYQRFLIAKHVTIAEWIAKDGFRASLAESLDDFFVRGIPFDPTNFLIYCDWLYENCPNLHRDIAELKISLGKLQSIRPEPILDPSNMLSETVDNDIIEACRAQNEADGVPHYFEKF